MSGPLRWALRLPIWLYRARLGWLLGNRFLLLIHHGRRSGRRHQTVLEVVRHDPATDAYIIGSGWGDRADWLLNIEHTPQVVVTVGRRHLAMTAERLTTEQAAQELGEYARRHPIAASVLARFLFGQPIRGTVEDNRQLARSLPMVALRPDVPGE